MADLLPLLDEAVGLSPDGGNAFPGGRFVAVEDCVEASGAFLLHHVVKRWLSGGGSAVFLGLAQPFSHYDRILRKMGCNMTIQRKNDKLHFFDLLEFQGESTSNSALHELYLKIRGVVGACKLKNPSSGCMIIVDDLSLLEVAVHGLANDDVLDFLHYCVALSSEMDCSLFILNHDDIYSDEQDPGLLLRVRYYADTVIRIRPLSTGLATDVHGEVTFVSKSLQQDHKHPMHKVCSFHFQVKETGVDLFYPGSRS